MPNVPFQVGDGIQIGAAVITASGAAIVLPANTSVGGTQVATSTDVSTGGGPKITNLQITDNSWTVLDDTAVDTAGGYVLITGTNFVSGAQVYLNQTAANSVAFVSATTLRVTVPALTAGTYIVYVINPDGGTAIRVPGLTASANPAWQTGSALPEQYDGVAITLNLVATDATSYTITSGSLPPGLSLNTGTGAITGTVTGVTVDTVYTFTIRATDAQLQDSPRTFTVTITVSDSYFKLTTLLLSGAAISANTVIRDSSTNNFNLTVSGDTRASNFTPYGTAWSVYFDGSGDYLTIPASANLSLGTNNFTIEFWMNATVYSRDPYDRRIVRCIADPMAGTGNGFEFSLNGNPSGGIGQLQFGASAVFVSTPGSVCDGTWKHIAVTRETNTFKLFLNGNIVATTTGTATITDGATYPIWIAWFGGTGQGHYNGYFSNFRIVRNEVLYTANFTPATASLTTTSNTALLTCHTFRFADSSANNLAITRTGDTRVVSFNPFNITNTGVNGSMYFDGSGDYVSIAANVNLSLTTSVIDFTIEAWVYPLAYTGPLTTIISVWPQSSSDQYIFCLNSSGILEFNWSPYSTGAAFISSGTVPLRQYSHVAVTRSGNTFRTFINGSLIATATNSGTSGSDAQCNIGYYGTGAGGSATSYWNGYISNLRVVKGTALYTASFTPSSSPLTAVANTQLLTLQYDQPHNNHTFLDSSSNQFLITRNGNATQGTFSPFSQAGWSNYFPSNAYLSIGTTAAFSFGTGDFTAEGWIYTNSTTVCMFDARSAGSASPWVLNAGSGSSTYYYDGTSYTSSIGITLGQWNHVAVARQSGVLRIFVNGQQGYSASHTVNQDRTAGIRIGDVVQTGQNWTGYLSNLRIVKGQALYTGSFTPPTTVLATNSVGTTGANVAVSITSPVSLLTAQSNRFIDNSSNNFAITATNSPQVQAFSPFATTAVYNPVSHGGSVYLDGTGDYLNTGSDVGLNLGVGNFTWEFWTYLTASPADGNVLFQPRTPAGIDAALFGYKSGSNFTIYATTDGGGSWNLFSNTVIIAVADVLNRWAHWAFTRNGNTYTVYVDGVSKVTGTSANQISQATNVFTLGAQVNGYFSGFRFVKAQALSTGNFTPPTAPLTANTVGWTGANVATSLTGTVNLLLNFSDAAIIDSTGRNVLETAADARTSSVVTKFTGGSMYFDGTGDAINIRSSDLLTFGTGDWTVEFWVYHTSVSGQQTYLGDTGGATSGPYIYKDSSHKVGLYYSSQILTGTTTIAINTWYYIVLSRASGTVRLFINGIQDTSASDTTNLSVAIQWVGGDTFPSGYLSGYMNDIRVTKGYARYTANFTAPTIPARLK